MGTFFVEIEIGGPEGKRRIPVEALVDTGASTCSLPSSLLANLGVSPSRQKDTDLPREKLAQWA